MGDDGTPAQDPPLAEGGRRRRVTIGGEEFLDTVIQTVSGDDVEKRAWARSTVDHEDTVASFVAGIRRALRSVREARGLSIEAVAEQVGVTTSTLSRLEAGAAAKADIKLVTRVALSLGVVPRLEFAVRGSAASVTVGGRQTAPFRAAGFQDVDQPSLTVLPVARGEGADRVTGVGGADPSAGSAAQDPTALDRRIRELEARIAAMEHPKPENSD